MRREKERKNVKIKELESTNVGKLRLRIYMKKDQSHITIVLAEREI